MCMGQGQGPGAGPRGRVAEWECAQRGGGARVAGGREGVTGHDSHSEHACERDGLARDTDKEKKVLRAHNTR